MSRRVVTVVAAVLAIALVLGGIAAAVSVLLVDRGTTSTTSERAAPRRTPAQEEPAAAPAELASFYAQTIAWEPCGDNRCGTLEVPLDYAAPTGETIELALLEVPARQQDEKLGALVVNPGGPGASGVEYAAAADDVLGPALRDYFDVVGFDPRGVAGSSPVDCLSDEQLDRYVAADPDPDTAAEVQAAVAGVDTFGAGCVERSGDLAGHVSTVETVRDLDVLRAALGQPRLDYFGASYGTKIGATYATLFPDTVGHLVLDGAVDPALDNEQLALGQAGGFETALRAYVQNCVDQPSCFLGDSVEAGLTTISDLLDAIDADPLPTDDGDRELAIGNANLAVSFPLYNRDYWVVLSQALRSALDGDGTTMLALSDAYTSRGPDGYTSNLIEALYAINCLDDPSSVTAAQVPGLLPDFERVSPTLGDQFAWSLLSCGGSQVRAEEPAPVIDGAGAAPVLVIGTTRDPATPYAWAVSLADQLESGVLLSRDGDGHTAFREGNQCIDDAVEAYLLDDVVPPDGASC